MLCEKPKRLRGDDLHKVPCGGCPACLSRRPSEWSIRLQLEAWSYPVSSFCTLTFSDDHLPRDRKALVRVVRALTRILPCRYLLVSERGGLRQRIHLHLAMLGISPPDAERWLGEHWKHGFTDVTDLLSRAGYLSKYVVKDSHSKDVQEFYADGLGPNIFRQSRPAVGAIYAERLAARYKVEPALQAHVDLFKDIVPTLRLDGRLVRLPRYVVEKIRCLAGLSTYDPDREAVQKIRRSEAAADSKYQRVSERRRIVGAAAARIKAERAAVTRRALDPQLAPAEKALAAAVRAGKYETRKARRARLKAARRRAEVASAAASFASESTDG